jgi:hypothetical protein
MVETREVIGANGAYRSFAGLRATFAATGKAGQGRQKSYNPTSTTAVPQFR